MIRFKQPIKLIVILLVIGAALLLTASLALAQAQARVYAQPVETSDSQLVVDIIAENVTDLYGAEFRLTYDPAVVAVQDFKPEQDGAQIQVGTLLAPDKGFVVANQVDETTGTVTFAMTLLNPAPAVTGSGPLARVSFNILQNTPSTINVEHAKLVSLDLETIPTQTSALAIGSSDSQPVVVANPPAPTNSIEPAVTAPATQAEGFPWWIVAAVIMVLGILALGGFIVMDGLKSASTGPANRPSSQ
jgi:hypothetical protein